MNSSSSISSTSTSSFLKERERVVVEPFSSFLPLSPTLLTNAAKTATTDQSRSNLPFYTNTNVYDKRFCLPPIQTTKEYMESPMRKPHPPPLTHIVSPEAIREAQKEETEDDIFSQSRPFSAYPSFLLLKQHPIPATTDIDTANDNVDDEDDEDDDNSTVITSQQDRQQPQEQQQQQQQQQQQEHKQSDSKEKLKRPPNAYLLFNRDMRRKLLEQSPKMTVGEISKEIGYWWKALPADQRQFYIKEASLLKQEHLRKHPDFIYTRRSKAELAQAKKNSNHNQSKNKGLLSDIEDTEEEEDGDGDDHQKRKRRRRRNNGEKDPRGRKKKRIKHPFAPKHPMSAYLYYLASVYPEVSQSFPGSTVGPISKSISKTWHAMSKEERSPWIAKAESDKARYAREMQVYMSSLNQEDQDKDKDQDQEEEDLDIHTLAAVVEMVNNNTNA